MPIIENRLTGRLCRFVEYERLPEGPRVWVEDLQTGIRTPYTEHAIAPYVEGKVVDFCV